MMKNSRGIYISIIRTRAWISSFGFVRDIEFDTLKIDRSFLKGDIEEKKNKALIEGITVLAKKLGVKTVVKGVENAA